MASRNHLLPTALQCLALTDEQCRRIMDLRDPDGIRAHGSWEQEYQFELVRQYMTMKSFTDIERAMRGRLDWSYKTYSNRYADWLFPKDRLERELAIVELYNAVAGGANEPRASEPPESSPPGPPGSQFSLATPTVQQSIPQSQHAPQLLLVPEQVSQQLHIQTPMRQQTPFQPSLYTGSHDPLSSRSDTSDTMSISTYSSAFTPSEYSIFDDGGAVSSPRLSISTANTSVSSGSQYGFQQEQQQVPNFHQQRLQHRPLARVPKHDARLGTWNLSLRAIPCGQDHSRYPWERQFTPCQLCGFSQTHALMMNAPNIPFDTFVIQMNNTGNVQQVDLAGNGPLHFLMASGVSLDYLQHVVAQTDNFRQNPFGQNAFGQNPLHVLNPQDLGDHLINVLEWFSPAESLLSDLYLEYDMRARTPLHELLQHPFEREMYRKILNVYPCSSHYLRSFDHIGKTVFQIMSDASMRLRTISESAYAKIQTGIAEIQLVQRELNGGRDNSARPYGYVDIARGARGMSYGGMSIVSFFQCQICFHSNMHKWWYLDQMVCAGKQPGLDRTGPDKTGMTPAHLLVTHARCDDTETRMESPERTLELFRLLIKDKNPNAWNDVVENRKGTDIAENFCSTTMRCALRVLDKDGNSLIFNIATRGYIEILKDVLSLEEPGRRCAMVNAYGKDSKGNERSILEAVEENIKEVYSMISTTKFTKSSAPKGELSLQYNRLKSCKHFLQRHGAELKPSITKRWCISPRPGQLM